MLEENLPDNNLITKIFINGSYYFRENLDMSVNDLKAFIELLRSCSREKGNIILSNIHTKLDVINRYDDKFEDDDIPF